MNSVKQPAGFYLCLSALIAFLIGNTANASSGDSIIEAVDSHEDGYRNLKSNVTMILDNGAGRTRERHLDVYTIESLPFGDKRRFVFNQPADINGTAVLIHSNVVKDDDQWVYLPAFKRIKRVASRNKSSPFVGSEYSYEDLASQEQPKYINAYLQSVDCGELKCDMVERVPNFPNSAYSKIVVYVDKQHRRYRKVEYFDKSGKHTKTQLLEDYQLYDKRYWLANKSTMINHVNNKKTIMLWKNIQLKTAQNETQFTANALKRAR